jgi:hypothetical protein
VEEPRGLKLTSTNRSIGLNDHCSCTATTASPQTKTLQTMSSLVSNKSFRAGLADLAAMPGGPHLIPSRTQSLSPPGPMVLCLKAWESRSLPGLQDPRERKVQWNPQITMTALAVTLPAALNTRPFAYQRSKFAAGWSSPVARQAHNLKVVGSNPTPAPN